MILEEQRYTNLNRIYYHDQIPNFDNEKRKFKEFYLTTRFLYSLSYAFDENHNFGKIEFYKLKKRIKYF